MLDWEAALLGYIIAMVIAETEAAPVAVAGAWGVAIFMLIDQVATGGATLGKLTGAISSSASQPATQIPTANNQNPQTGAAGPVGPIAPAGR